jgi:hypothetical protein
MSDALLRDLPRTLPAFVERFGSDAQCRAHLVRMLWPEGFRCAGCGHHEAWSHKNVNGGVKSGHRAAQKSATLGVPCATRRRPGSSAVQIAGG